MSRDLMISWAQGGYENKTGSSRGLKLKLQVFCLSAFKGTIVTHLVINALSNVYLISAGNRDS